MKTFSEWLEQREIFLSANWLESFNALRFKGYKRKPFSLDKELASYGQQEEESDLPKPIGPVKPNHYLDYDTISNSYNQYYDSMGRKRHGTQLPWENFFNYVSQPDVRHVKHKDSIVYGQMYDDVFVPSHFAPKSLRQGLELIEKLKTINAALMVPEDLSKMAQKVGFILIKKNMPAYFRDEIIEKDVLASNKYVARKIKKYIDYELNALNNIG